MKKSKAGESSLVVNPKKKKVEEEWCPTDKSNSRTDKDWERIMAVPDVKEEKEKEENITKKVKDN